MRKSNTRTTRAKQRTKEQAVARAKTRRAKRQALAEKRLVHFLTRIQHLKAQLANAHAAINAASEQLKELGTKVTNYETVNASDKNPVEGSGT